MRKICACLIAGILVIGSLTGCACGRASQIVGTWNEVQDYSQVNSEPAAKVCGIWIPWICVEIISAISVH